MKNLGLACLVLFAVPALAGKPKAAEKNGSVLASCDTSKKGGCVQYSGWGSSSEAAEKKSCDDIQGAWKTGASCPAPKLLATCSKSDGMTYYWYDAGSNAGGTKDDLGVACQAEGGKLDFKGK